MNVFDIFLHRRSHKKAKKKANRKAGPQAAAGIMED
jgi:hypothetical protein